ncbi:hypothetical protein DRE_02928 [Drechslerella stenobrocha 248]|uniref:Uncharacterized protein n=1 Tax=Drechslerella stenobrocha 248 TaxID=1043628 RepID=W7I6C8_9PEZI|nr:hypothetical protein DRE_02928 [Drechslerella stenobrocha 248]
MPCKGSLPPMEFARDDTPPQIWDRIMRERQWVGRKVDAFLRAGSGSGERVRYMDLMRRWEKQQRALMRQRAARLKAQQQQQQQLLLQQQEQQPQQQ